MGGISAMISTKTKFVILIFAVLLLRADAQTGEGVNADKIYKRQSAALAKKLTLLSAYAKIVLHRPDAQHAEPQSNFWKLIEDSMNQDNPNTWPDMRESFYLLTPIDGSIMRGNGQGEGKLMAISKFAYERRGGQSQQTLYALWWLPRKQVILYTPESMDDLKTFTGLAELKKQGAYPEVVIFEDPAEQPAKEVIPATSPQTPQNEKPSGIFKKERESTTKTPRSFFWIWVLPALLMALVGNWFFKQK